MEELKEEEGEIFKDTKLYYYKNSGKVGNLNAKDFNEVLKDAPNTLPKNAPETGFKDPLFWASSKTITQYNYLIPSCYIIRFLQVVLLDSQRLV